ncbi:MAG: hypothetical protein MK116_13050 [Phycisphaerales bacterium]|nr:hypothetical protein [Phycisphaerales bacterium]
MSIKSTAVFAVLLVPGLVLAADLSDSTVIEIEKTWDQEPGGWTYPIAISVPDGSPPPGGFPVCILLHGNGGNGSSMVGGFRDVLECHALVAPSGYASSWNICGENSDAPDVEMVTELVEILQQCDNVNPDRIQIVGFSNGSALTNRIMIENDNPGITTCAAVVSQLAEIQFQSGVFYGPGGLTDPDADQCGYDTSHFVIPGRRYLNICNQNDPIIPYNGGESPVGVEFIPAQWAAFFLANTQGYDGEPILGAGTQIDGTDVFEYVYLDGDVTHLRGFAQHGMNSTQQQYLADFLAGCDIIEDCPGDVTGDQVVDVDDVLALIASWDTPDADADFDEDGLVDTDDLLFLLANYGIDC